ncbi:MAG: ABC transporter ATP-binding protein [Alphaproteobacteria bacterium]|nr:ABC transporter ATP-binding protein [Alphaproteobacteria bacterium]
MQSGVLHRSVLPSNVNYPSVASPEPLVRFINVQKTYDGEILVVRDLNLSVRCGEFLTLLGPSGSGKTTTLLMLAGFEYPTAGRIELDGRSLEREPPYRRDIGMVFQDYALFPHMSVVENVGFPLSVRRRPKQEIRNAVQDALAMVKLDGFEDRRPNQLSGGQQQRVALARALVFRPRLVLMDEPLGALDKQLREQMQLEIKRIQRQLGVTMVYVTHDQAEALVMSDRIAVFAKGSIRQLDTPAELYEHPRSAFVAQFLGENNQLTGRIVGFQGGLANVELDGGICVLALPVGAESAGEQTLLSLRPERISLGAVEGSCENRFNARVSELVYLGDHLRVRVSLEPAAIDLIAKLPLVRRHMSLEVGMSVDVGWAAEDCRVLAAP